MQKKKAQNQVKLPIKQDKPVHAYGTWVFKTTKSQIYICSCGGKYLKTRKNQTKCVACLRLDL
jgi:hypothetical protein